MTEMTGIVIQYLIAAFVAFIQVGFSLGIRKAHHRFHGVEPNFLRLLARKDGFEPPQADLEAAGLPLSYSLMGQGFQPVYEFSGGP